MIENNFSSKKIDKVTIVKGIVFLVEVSTCIRTTTQRQLLINMLKHINMVYAKSF